MSSKKNIFLIILFFLSISVLSPNVFAKESVDEVGYSIQAILPNNQLDKKKTYFDLKMKPEQKQTIHLLIKNTSDKKQTYTININQAYTNDQGFIDYTQEGLFDDSLNYKIDDILTYDREVTVKPHDEKKVAIHITMPKKIFDGKIMAGINVMKKKDRSKETTGIVNEVGYVLGLTLSETDKPIERQILLDYIEPQVSFGQPSIVVLLKNPKMEAYGHLKYTVNIIDETTDKTVHSVTYDNDMEFAPNSTYRFAIEIRDKPLKAGDYVLDLAITDKKDNKWTFKEPFKVTKEQARSINDITIQTDKTSAPWWLYVIITILILGIVIISRLLYKKKKKKKKKRKHPKKSKK